MKNSYENMEDMQRMQQEAVRRVREMQKRAKQSLSAGIRYSESNHNQNPNQEHNQNLDQNHNHNNENILNDSLENNQVITESSDTSAMSDQNKKIQSTQNKSHMVNNRNKFDFFSALLNDHEKSLILVLILLLIDEGSDMSLIMALMYLII